MLRLTQRAHGSCEHEAGEHGERAWGVGVVRRADHGRRLPGPEAHVVPERRRVADRRRGVPEEPRGWMKIAVGVLLRHGVFELEGDRTHWVVAQVRSDPVSHSHGRDARALQHIRWSDAGQLE